MKKRPGMAHLKKLTFKIKVAWPVRFESRHHHFILRQRAAQGCQLSPEPGTKIVLFRYNVLKLHILKKIPGFL